MSRKLKPFVVRWPRKSVALVLLTAMSCSPIQAQAPAESIASNDDSAEVEREDGWVSRKGELGTSRTRRLTLHPQLEPVPALQYRLIPDDYERIDGNAAVFYLKAMGFLEESHAREMVTKFQRESAKTAEAQGKDDYPPYEWMKMKPKDLPVEKVKEFLRLVSFQEPILRDASYRTRFSLERNIRGIDNPIMYLLPEINQVRQVARYQSLRFRLALAEDRIDDAIMYLGQNYALASHLGHDDFFVSSLVGIAIGSIAWNDMLYLLERPDAPNMYWALATLPKPLVSIERAFAYERHLLFEQVKLLREIDTEPRSPGYWQDFVDRLITQSDSFEVVVDASWNLKSMDKTSARALVASAIATAYPGAHKFLLNEAKMDLETVNAYPKAQTVFLAVKIYSERARDEQLKWQYLPHPLIEASPLYAKTMEQLSIDAQRYGLITKPAQALLPAVQAIGGAVQRLQQYVAMAQTVEAIRFHAAKHEGKLPQNLASLELPAISDPITGRPFEYRLNGNRAVLRAAETSGIQNRFVLQIAK